MAEHFYTILTDIGKAKIANSQVLGAKVNITAFAVGDGGGAYYNPVSTQTALQNELWRGTISKIETDESNPNWIVVEAVIPTTDGGFMIREAAIFDAAGDMIAIGKHAETYKPVVSEGSAKDLFIRMILEVSNTASVTLKVDPAVVLATKQDVNAIAGAGRTIETVKGNADAIANLSQTVTENQASVNAQLADMSQDIGTEPLNTTAQNIKAAVNELEARPQKDMDNGRYQAEFGWDGVELVGVRINSDNKIILGFNYTSPFLVEQTLSTANIAVHSNIGAGQRLLSNFDKKKGISKVFIAVDSIAGIPPSLYCTIFNKTTNKVLGTVSKISSTIALDFNEFDFSGLNIAYNTTDEIEIRAHTNGLGDSSNRYSLQYNSSNVLNNSGYIVSSNSFATYTNESSNLNCDLKFKVEFVDECVSGTVTKTYTPSDLKKWGNVKFDKATPVNTSVVCDVYNTESYLDVPCIPIMTSNIGANGVSSTDGTGDAWIMFSGSSSDSFSINNNKYGQYKFNSGKIINKIGLKPNDANPTYMPATFKFQASNDGTTFVDLFVQSTPISDWSIGQTKYFNIPNLVSYSYYRILQLAGNAGTTSYIGEMYIYEYITPIKSNITSTSDLSDIDITQYPSLKLRWTLTRNSTSDASPTVSNPSVTWEGVGTGVWKVIADVTLDGNIAQVDFENLRLEDYRWLKLAFSARTGTGYTDYVYIRFNDDSTANYKRATATAVNGIGFQLPSYSNPDAFDLCELVVKNDLSKYKTCFTQQASGVSVNTVSCGRWENISNLISKISLVMSTPMATGSTFTLMGVK